MRERSPGGLTMQPKSCLNYRMRTTLAMIILGVLSGVAVAQEPADVQTLAAANDARETLRQQVLATRVAPRLTVRQLLDQTGGFDELDKALHTAQQIGGARWLDHETVQVRLLIEGAAVADALNAAVAKNPSRSPLPPDTIRRDLAPWRERTFSATGTGTSGADVAQLRPPPDDVAWASVSDGDRRRAVAMARENAISRMFESLRPIELADDKTLGDALAIPELGQGISNWLYGRPIESVEFRDDLSVRLALNASTAELWHVLEPELARQKQLPLPATKQGWDWLEKQIDARVAPAIGTGLIQAANPATRVAEVPSEAPSWVLKPLIAEGTSKGNGPKLQTARAAEAVALQALRHQIELLPLTPALNIGQASRQDPRIEKALIRAVNRAHPFEVDYKADGAVTVHVTTSAADLWALLSAAP